MFGFKKKEQKPLWIMGKDVMDPQRWRSTNQNTAPA